MSIPLEVPLVHTIVNISTSPKFPIRLTSNANATLSSSNSTQNLNETVSRYQWRINYLIYISSRLTLHKSMHFLCA